MKRVVVLAAMVCAGAAMAAPEWKDITPGADLAGWKAVRGEWKVENGEVVARAEGKPAAWLLSDAVYADFELEVEFKTPEPCNGGLQFRGHLLPKRPIPDEVAPKDLELEVYGYQANVETRKKEGTAALVDDHLRGYIGTPGAEAQQAVKATDWNRLQVRAAGQRIVVSVNGVTAVDMEDYGFTKGFVGLQVMAGEEGKTAEVRYRNLRIKDLGRVGAWEPLFDGKSLDGWVEWGEEKWDVEDGVIFGRSGPKKSEGYLATERTWKDFHVRGTYKTLGKGNFGLFYHSTIKYNEKRYPIISGVQGEVAPEYPGPSGWVYESYKRGWLIKPDMKSIGAYASPEGEWNEIEILNVGNRTVTWVNGVQIIDLDDKTPNLFEGSLALQLHAGGVDGIAWKNIVVRDPAK